MWRWLIFAILAVVPVKPALAQEHAVAAQIRRHAGEHRLVVLGEYHGTREIPRLVAALAEEYGRDGAPLWLGLEVPRTENAALRDYLHSEGGATDRETLRQRPFWRVESEQHDGRRSRDMLALLETLRGLRAQGRVLDVFGYDVPASGDGAQARDDAMAAFLRERMRALPASARLLVLTGNVHAMLARPDGAPREMMAQPMASQLRDLDIYSVRIEALEGSFWGCAQVCRAYPLPPRTVADPRMDTHPARQYDLMVWLPCLSIAQLVD